MCKSVYPSQQSTKFCLISQPAQAKGVCDHICPVPRAKRIQKPRRAPHKLVYSRAGVSQHWFTSLNQHSFSLSSSSQCKQHSFSRAMTFETSATTPLWVQVSANKPGYFGPHAPQHGLDQSEKLLRNPEYCYQTAITPRARWSLQRILNPLINFHMLLPSAF